MKPLLRFVNHLSEKKTKDVDVFSTHSGDYLGTIHWRNTWRCYVISFAESVDMSLSCMEELSDFMELLEKERGEVKEINELRTKEPQLFMG
jgi:hypothetical protein